jgi:diguanylate cyclase (GGDEF)-like protein
VTYKQNIKIGRLRKYRTNERLDDKSLECGNKELGEGDEMSQHVLVVDKDKQLGALVSSVLSARGLEVTFVPSGQDALQVKSKSQKLIVVGEQLSDIDGLGFIAKLREDDEQTPVVFVARQWRDENFYRMLRQDLKVSLVVHRPLRSSIFSAQLNSLLGDDKADSALVETASEVAMPLSPGAAAAAATRHAGEQFDRLKTRFVKSIPERLTKLEASLNALSNGNFIPADLENAITYAHNMKGTALSWGYEDLGRSAEVMESALKSVRGAEETKRVEIIAALAEKFGVMVECAGSVLENFSALAEADFSSGAFVPNEDDSSAAKVLIVSDDPPPSSRGRTESGLVLDIIHVSKENAIEKASQHLLDAALIEIGQSNASLGIARELRDLAGYETLPLGFIATPDAADARADATHAGSSLFLAKPLDSEIVQKVISQLIAMRQGGRFRVLVVDDDVDLANLTSRCLGQFGMLTRTLNDPLLINPVLDEFNPDLILLDVNMPGISGFEVCRALRNQSRWRDLPILFLTAQTDLNSRLTAYEAGADDYLPKPVINVELLTRVKVRLERARELKERSERDLLTGLLLRRAFYDQISALMAECNRYNFHFSLCLLDVDHFKKVNDTYGHKAGDDVLTALGLLLRRRFRVEDLRGRWGGEEFILAFKHEHKDVMKLALERIMQELKSIDFAGENGEKFNVTFSAGLSTFPSEATTFQELLKIADQRLYIAKDKGRKQIVISG